MPEPGSRNKAGIDEARLYRPNRAIIARRLALAKRHVEEGALSIAHQRWISSDLDRRGHTQAAMKAREHVAMLEHMQVGHMADRDRLQAELDGFAPPESMIAKSV